MFLERVASLGLLHHAPDTNILKEFPLEVRQIISTEVVHYLMESKTEVTKVLSSRAHVIWAMECIGTAFTLPLDQEETMAKAVELYRRWTLEPNRKDCPVAIQEDYQFFLQVCGISLSGLENCVSPAICVPLPHSIAQKLLSHCSLMFGSRTKDPAQLDSQASLCKRVLNIYHTVGKDRSNLTRETWDLFLKLMLGVTDSLLSAPPGQDGLAQRLCSHVLKVLLESWLYSSTNDAAMWGSLLKHSCNWIRFMPTITHWNAFSKALTERSISLLYGPKEGKTSVNIRVEGANEVTTIKLDDELVLYAWHKMLHAIGDPNRIEDPSIFVTAFRGIDTLVNLYLQVGKENEKSYALNTPSGNTILHIFGAWLFHAIKHKHEGFEEGQALAVKALCNIFHKRKDTEYPTIYLSRFFECLHKVLQQDGRVLISAIVHSAPLFSHELPGFRSLIPAYIYALNRILLRKTSNYEHFASQEDVRKACIRILAQILPLPNHFGDTPFAVKTVMPSIITSPASAKDTISPNLPEVDTYTKLKPHLRVLLIEALNNELIPNNVRLLLPLCYQFATEDITSDSGFAKRMIMAIGQKITKQEWSSQCTVDAFQTLGYFASLYSYLQGATEVANYVVFSLAHMFSSSDASAPVITDSAEQEKQMIGALQCITHWLAVDDWLLGFPLCKQAVLRFILSALPVTQRKLPQIEEIEPQKNPAAKNSEEKDKKESKNKKDKRKSKKESLSSTKNPLTGSTTLVTRPVVKERKEIGAKLQEAARWALATLLNLAGTFPLPHGTGTDCRISSLVTEEDLLSIIPNDGLPASQLPANFIRFFATKGALVTVIDRPNNGDPFVTIIIRDRTGRQAWNLRSTPLSPEDIMLISNAIAPPSTSPCVEPFHDLTPLKAQEALVNVFQYLEEWNEDPLCAASAQQASVEQQVLEQSQFNLKQVSCVPPTGRNSTQHYTEEPGPTHIYGDTNVLCKFLQGRLFLSSVGFLSINNQPHFFQIQQSAEFYNALSQLDQEPERECFTLGVCYVKHDQTMEQILSNHGGPSAYQHFLASLGWPIDVKSHTGFLGGLDREVLSTGTVAPYFADFSKEIVFHAPSHMPAINDKDALAQRAKLLHSNYVFILWTEDDLEHYSMAKYPDLCKQSNVHIVIHPLDSALYHVRVYHQNTEVKLTTRPSHSDLNCNL
ncbi:Ral GTPase-activating protein subunit alpha-1 [Balamuthia mandrillaris]